MLIRPSTISALSQWDARSLVGIFKAVRERVRDLICADRMHLCMRFCTHCMRGDRTPRCGGTSHGRQGNWGIAQIHIAIRPPSAQRCCRCIRICVRIRRSNYLKASYAQCRQTRSPLGICRLSDGRSEGVVIHCCCS